MALGEKPKKSRAPLYALLFLVAVVALGVAVWTGKKVGGEPKITIEAPASIGKAGKVVVTVQEPVRGVIDVDVVVEGAGLPKTVVGGAHNPPPASAFDPAGPSEARVEVVIGKEKYPALTEGTLTLTVTATRAPSWLSSPDPVTATQTMTVKLTPPTVTPMSSFVHVAQGGAEAIVYEVGAGAADDGVVVERSDGGEPWKFKGFQLPGAPPTRHFAIWALPYDDAGPEADVKTRVKVYACDELQNCSSAPFVNKYIPRPMGTDTIELGDALLAKVTGEIFPQTPALSRSGDALADYLVLNRELRKTNNAFLVELSKKTQPKFLWTLPFQPFGDAAIKGAFADRRTYTKNGQKVDQQDHLGFDLARVERAPINAGNDGVVAFAGYFGIYGNCVVVDHGYGVMSLYAHLSAINVKEGDTVKRGDTLGLTGATGLAGGDHLHFTTLVGGRAVNPIEWWDGHWIADRIKLKLGEAMPFTEK